MSDPKFCRDCGFASRNWLGHVTQASRCLHNLAAKSPDKDLHTLITGKSYLEDQWLCAFMRGPSDECGPKAKLFEARS